MSQGVGTYRIGPKVEILIDINEDLLRKIEQICKEDGYTLDEFVEMALVKAMVKEAFTDSKG